jgi:hypothetical protein
MDERGRAADGQAAIKKPIVESRAGGKILSISARQDRECADEWKGLVSKECSDVQRALYLKMAYRWFAAAASLENGLSAVTSER